MNLYTIEELYRLAQNGNTEALVRLGLCYKEGNQIDVDYGAAARCFYEAAKKGYAGGQYQLGICYEYGIGIEQDLEAADYWYQEAARQFYEAARLGKPQAQYGLANCYSDGRGVEQNPEAAVYWYQAAAEQDYADAQYNLGYCYLFGIGTEKNEVVGLNWYQKAAEHGDCQMQHNLGMIYKEGYGGIPKNYGKAAEWLFKAARQGSSVSKMELALIYFRDPMAVKDVSVAERLMAEAADEGLIDAQLYLMHYYFDQNPKKRDMRKAYTWAARVSKQQKDPTACVIIGVCCEEGRLFVRNEELASKWLSEVEEQQDVLTGEACYYLGTYYQEGKLKETDYERAAYFYHLSDQKGCLLGQQGLESLRVQIEEEAFRQKAERERVAAEEMNVEKKYEEAGVLEKSAESDSIDEEIKKSKHSTAAATVAAIEAAGQQSQPINNSLAEDTKKSQKEKDTENLASVDVETAASEEDTSKLSTFEQLRRQIQKNRESLNAVRQETKAILDEDDKLLIQAYEEEVSSAEDSKKEILDEKNSEEVSKEEVFKEEAPEEEILEEEAPEEKVLEEEAPEEEVLEEEAPEEEVLEEEAPEEEVLEEEAPEEEALEEEAPEEEVLEEEAPEEEVLEEEAPEEEVLEEEAPEEEVLEEEAPEEEVLEKEAPEEEVLEEEAPEEEVLEEEVSEEEVFYEDSSDEKASDDKKIPDRETLDKKVPEIVQPIVSEEKKIPPIKEKLPQLEKAKTEEPVAVYYKPLRRAEIVSEIDDEMIDYIPEEVLPEEPLSEEEDDDEWEASHDQFVAALLAAGARVTNTTLATPKKRKEEISEIKEYSKEENTDLHAPVNDTDATKIAALDHTIVSERRTGNPDFVGEPRKIESDHKKTFLKKQETDNGSEESENGDGIRKISPQKKINGQELSKETENKESLKQLEKKGAFEDAEGYENFEKSKVTESLEETKVIDEDFSEVSEKLKEKESSKDLEDVSLENALEEKLKEAVESYESKADDNDIFNEDFDEDDADDLEDEEEETESNGTGVEKITEEDELEEAELEEAELEEAEWEDELWEDDEETDGSKFSWLLIVLIMIIGAFAVAAAILFATGNWPENWSFLQNKSIQSSGTLQDYANSPSPLESNVNGMEADEADETQMQLEESVSADQETGTDENNSIEEKQSEPRTFEEETESEEIAERVQIPAFSDKEYQKLEVPSSGCVYAKLGNYDEKDNIVYAGKITDMDLAHVAENANGMNVIGDTVYYVIKEGSYGNVYRVSETGGEAILTAANIAADSDIYIMNNSIFAGNREYVIGEDTSGKEWEGVTRFLTFSESYAYYLTGDGEIGRALFNGDGAETFDLLFEADEIAWGQAMGSYLLLYSGTEKMLYSYDLNTKDLVKLPFAGIEDSNGLIGNGNWVYGVMDGAIVRVYPNGSGLETVVEAAEEGMWSRIVHAMEHYIVAEIDGAGEYLVNVENKDYALIVDK